MVAASRAMPVVVHGVDAVGGDVHFVARVPPPAMGNSPSTAMPRRVEVFSELAVVYREFRQVRAQP